MDPSKLYSESSSPLPSIPPAAQVDSRHPVSSSPSPTVSDSSLSDLFLASIDDLVGSYILTYHNINVRLDLNEYDIFRSRRFLASVKDRPPPLRKKYIGLTSLAIDLPPG